MKKHVGMLLLALICFLLAVGCSKADAKEELRQAETITYNGKEYSTDELCDATLHWLGLSPEERMFSSYMPEEFLGLAMVDPWIYALLYNVVLTAAVLAADLAALYLLGRMDLGGKKILAKQY